MSSQRWQFWIDRGGTFTDIVARRPNGELIIHKLLSENPEKYTDAVIQGIREILGVAPQKPLPAEQIAAIKMGTTVATNALLERKGDRTVLLITKGFKDALRIGYQNRPDIFALEIVLPQMLYERVIEVSERYSAQGEELLPVTADFMADLQAAYDDGIRACAIAFMHGYKYPDHEEQVAAIARQMGFTQVSVSHQVSPLMKLVSRGDTTVVDAYLSPILRRYVRQVSSQLESRDHEGNTPKLFFMQSHGGLTDAESFQGKDSILSGPAGGIVGAVQTSLKAGFEKIITFDMGGTSTDVAHYQGEYERSFTTEVAGVRLRAPMMAIHTVAAGGGSIVRFDGSRYRVGPESAGANPGPACYRRGGPLTVTDCNVMLGRLQPQFFPHVFGKSGDLPLDVEIVQQQFRTLAEQIQIATSDNRTPEAVAAGFLAIAVDKMAAAIKKISVQRGYDVSDYTLCCFGGAGGQHACAIADALGMQQIFVHAYAGVLSAYGMGLAATSLMREQAVESILTIDLLPYLYQLRAELASDGQAEMERWHTDSEADNRIAIITSLRIRYAGTDSALEIGLPDESSDQQAILEKLQIEFTQAYQQRYSFAFTDKALIVEAIAVEVVSQNHIPESLSIVQERSTPLQPTTTVEMYVTNQWQTVPLYERTNLLPGDVIASPAIIIDSTGTTVLELGWAAIVNEQRDLILNRATAIERSLTASQTDLTIADPVKLEIFNNLYRAIAEQMGITLQNTSYSVNIKERLDFSCAIFDGEGKLVANAPHIPVHLGSMGETVQALLHSHGSSLAAGDVYAINSPYNGGTHLPDITVITPVFAPEDLKDLAEVPASPLFFVASRGHHADVGGITPGSMPPQSTNITEEGIAIDNFKLVERGRFREQEILEILTAGEYPVRNPQQNLADLQAQIAANESGVRELQRLVRHYGLAMVQAYMQHVQDNAEVAVRNMLSKLGSQLQSDASSTYSFTYTLDSGSQIQVAIAINSHKGEAVIDFTGTSPQQPNNFNAPLAVCKAAVLYVIRTLVSDDIPLNAGCLKPLEIIVPQGCMLNPQYPAAVVAGNVETSQAITNALYGALGIIASGQGTMNNFTFGNARYQYYETICGGSGAGINFHGTDAVHTHMTNSRLTDPEILEWRFPIILEEFAIRPHSGGKGKFQGGNGAIRRLKFREAMTASIISDRRTIPPFGLAGGEPGATGHNWVEKANGEVLELGSTAVVELEANDVIVIATPGGGGYGST